MRTLRPSVQPSCGSPSKNARTRACPTGSSSVFGIAPQCVVEAAARTPQLATPWRRPGPRGTDDVACAPPETTSPNNIKSGWSPLGVSSTDLGLFNRDFRFCPVNGHRRSVGPLPNSANSRSRPCSRNDDCRVGMSPLALAFRRVTAKSYYLQSPFGVQSCTRVLGGLDVS
jgi:hypothetical protein